MNEHLNMNACATLVRQAIPHIDHPDQGVLFLWTNSQGTGAPDLGLWEILVRRVPRVEEQVA